MNTHINKNKKKVKYERKFTGITVTSENYRELYNKAIESFKEKGVTDELALHKLARHELNYHSRHLEAYLKGKTSFRHGNRYDNEGKIVGPAHFKVMAELKEIE